MHFDSKQERCEITRSLCALMNNRHLKTDVFFLNDKRRTAESHVMLCLPQR